MFRDVVVKKQSTFSVSSFLGFLQLTIIYVISNIFFLQITWLRKTRFFFSVLCCLSSLNSVTTFRINVFHKKKNQIKIKLK